MAASHLKEVQFRQISYDRNLKPFLHHRFYTVIYHRGHAVEKDAPYVIIFITVPEAA